MIWRPGEALWIEAGGRRLEARCWGPPPDAAPTLVLLHEGLGCVALWRDFPERLAHETGWGVFAWSRAGYGQSDPCPLPRPVDYMEREAADVLPDVLAAAGLGRAVLLGHSDGGSIALLAQPDARIAGRVTLAAHVFVEEISVASIARAREAYRTTDLRTRLARYHADPDVAFGGWNDAWLDPEFRGWDITWCLWRVTEPVLVLQGSEDEYGTPAQVAAIAAGVAGPVATRLIAGAGHAPHLDRPEDVLGEVRAFLDRLPAP